MRMGQYKTKLRGYAALGVYFDRTISSRDKRDLILNPTGYSHPPGGIQYLQRDEIAFVVVIQNHAWLIFVTFSNSRLRENNGQSVSLAVINHFHGLSPIFLNLARPINSHNIRRLAINIHKDSQDIGL